MRALRRNDPRIRARFGLGALAAAVVALGSGVAATDLARADEACPASIVYFNRYSAATPFPVPASAYDSTFHPEPPDSPLYDTFTARVKFDRTQGTLSLSARSYGRLSASVRVVERFDVLGVPAGTPVPATLEFQLDGWSNQGCGGSGCGVEFAGTLVVGAASASADANQQGPGYRSIPLGATPSLPITFVAGSPIEAQFYMVYGTGPGGDAGAEMVGSYRVSGLPAGVRAIACGGADVTPVRRATWGSIKSIYR